MTQYIKKPVQVAAFQLTPENARELAAWCGGQLVEERHPIDRDKTYVGINVRTLEGMMRASEGDYIIRGVVGEFYPCKPHIFEQTYEAVE